MARSTLQQSTRQTIACNLLLFLLIAVPASTSIAQSQESLGFEGRDSHKEPQKREGGFLERLIKAYQDDWKGGPSGPEPARRIPPAPLDSPPFPNADWPYGGAPDIGAPDTNVYPLMQALNRASSKIKVYGWVEPSVNVSTSRHTLFPAGYNILSNTAVLDQGVIYIERLVDTVQTDHVDVGFHLTGFYGVDYRFTTAKGWLSQQLLKYNRQYGFDPMLEYADIYIPQVADGMNIRIGRYLSIPDIEAQLAPNNYIFTHSLLYSFDPFTQTGILTTVKLNNRWVVQAGLSAGNDIAPWAKGGKPSLTVCVSYTFHDGNDNLYPCVSGINSGKYAYNNVQFFVTTWNHKFNKSWHMATESWYMYQRDVPSVSPGLANPLPTETNANGAFCAPGQLKCFAPEWAIVNYLQKDFNTRNYISIRTDYLDDRKGQRTGFQTKYSEHTLMWGHWLGNTVLLRPELRFEHSYDVPAYDTGIKKNQFIFAVDMVYKF
ncbi:MAG TPA: outer membrane beta-barrel protein [Candidatus Angelobacter sp.]|nr:outer membrane beta-barrel protein [Candidatus Angelobacter sp.]